MMALRYHFNTNGLRTICRVMKPGHSTSYSGVNSQFACSSDTTTTTAVRHHYRNYQHHPSKIVRAYRMTRTWLTDHFVIAENRFENLYSFTFLVTMGVLLISVSFLNLQLGGEAGGLDVDRTKQNKTVNK